MSIAPNSPEAPKAERPTPRHDDKLVRLLHRVCLCALMRSDLEASGEALMSALGFGFFLGSFPAIIPASKGFPDISERYGGQLSAALVLIGLTGWATLPVLLGGGPDFLVGLGTLPIGIWVVRHRQISEFHALLVRESEEAARRATEEKEKRTQAQRAKEEWLSGHENEGWKYISEARMMNAEGQPHCAVMISENLILLKICEYRLDTKFDPSNPLIINVNQVLGINTAKPKITKRREKSVPVSIVENDPKSPIGRGLVGGALLGPAGLVLGAASGLNSKTSTSIQEHKVMEEYEINGDPQLIMGTSLPDRPVLKLKFEPPSLADEWMYRIRGAQQLRI